ncbi:MAG: hypothetical protein GTO04_17235, partial [Planctomycetales bacterium]|nr:hypothetical protein [Planctomycetales bacterium]
MKNYLSRILSRRRPRRASLGLRKRRAKFECLETRQMLAGNVAAIVTGGDLRLSGDNLDNAVIVSVVEGDVVVSGLNDTTVNGSDTPFVAFSATNTVPDDLYARLGGGADLLMLSNGLEVSDRVLIRGDSGSAQIGLDSVTIGDDLLILGGHSADVVHLNDVRVTDDIRIRLRKGDDVVHIEDTSVADLAVSTGLGNDAVVLDTLISSDDARIQTGRGMDDLVIQDAEISDNLFVRTKSGDDFVMVDPSTIGGWAAVSLGGGQDSYVDQGPNEYGGLHIRGGRGQDASEIDPATTFNGAGLVQRTESDVVPEAVVDQRLNDPVDGALSRAAAAAELFEDLNGDSGENTAPTTSGIDDITVEENSAERVVELFQAFADAEDADEDLVYTIEDNTNPELFNFTEIDDLTGQLTLDFAPGTSGMSVITVSATDLGGLTAETAFSVTVNPAGALSLTVDTSANETVLSNDTLL